MNISTLLFSLQATLASAAYYKSDPLSFPDTIRALPTCAYPALALALVEAGCPSSSITPATFECALKTHFSSITASVIKSGVPVEDCAMKFAYALGRSQSAYLLDPTAEEIDEAARVLAEGLWVGRTLRRVK